MDRFGSFAALAFDANTPDFDVLHTFPGWHALNRREVKTLQEQFGELLFASFRRFVESKKVGRKQAAAPFKKLSGVAPDGTRFRAVITLTLFEPADGSDVFPAMLSLERVKKTDRRGRAPSSSLSSITEKEK